MLLERSEIRFACLNMTEELARHVRHVCNFTSHAQELLYLVDHLVASTKDRRQPFDLVHISLLEPLAVFDE